MLAQGVGWQRAAQAKDGDAWGEQGGVSQRPHAVIQLQGLLHAHGPAWVYGTSMGRAVMGGGADSEGSPLRWAGCFS